MTLDLERNEVEQIVNVLAARPYGEVKMLIEKIIGQVNQPQNQQPAVAGNGAAHVQ